MNNTSLATVHPLKIAGRSTIPAPRSGVAAVTTLATPLSACGLVRVAELQPELDLRLEGESPPVPRPQLRLITADDVHLERIATKFAHALIEVGCGHRGTHQLLRWTSEEVYGELLHRSAALQRVAANAPRERRSRPQLRSVHLYQPHDDAAELSIHLQHGARSRVIAARIERAAGRWTCTAVRFG